MNKPLKILPGKKITGLTVFCQYCNADIGEVCKFNGKEINRCPHADKHVFKMYVHVPRTKNNRKTKKLPTLDINEAIKMALEFEKEVKQGTVAVPQPVLKKQAAPAPETIPILLSHAMARYVGMLNNENIETHMRKERTSSHIKDVERCFRFMANCLVKRGVDISTMKVEDINDKVVGLMCNALNEKSFSNRSFNKYVGYMSTFCNWYKDEYGIPMRNRFEKVQRKKINPNPQAITEEEFLALLDQIRPENGIKQYDKGIKTKRNFYRPWLKDGMRLALETGRRREEVINLKFCNIVDDANGGYLTVEDYKINRQQHRTTEEDKKIVYIPLTLSLRQLLNEMGYEKHKGKDIFILNPELQNNRTGLMTNALSNGFEHFYAQLHTGRKLTFKCLRKTYATSIALYTGGNAKLITQHADNQVVERHYIDKKVIASAAKEFSVFGTQHGRKNELDELRANLDNRKTMGLEK